MKNISSARPLFSGALWDCSSGCSGSAPSQDHFLPSDPSTTAVQQKFHEHRAEFYSSAEEFLVHSEKELAQKAAESVLMFRLSQGEMLLLLCSGKARKLALPL